MARPARNMDGKGGMATTLRFSNLTTTVGSIPRVSRRGGEDREEVENGVGVGREVARTGDLPGGWK
jgi:hypothetical protein